MAKIIAKIVAFIIIILFIAQTTFWLFKVNSTKRYVNNLIMDSNGKMTAASVAVIGFPFWQKVSIDDLKLNIDDISDKISLPNKYQISIKHLEAKSSVFSDNFELTIFDEIVFYLADNSKAAVEFNSKPQLNFLISKNKITKLSYIDSGYRIRDENKNILYESGKSSINFESIASGKNEFRNKIKIDFEDISGIDIFNPEQIVNLAISNSPQTATTAATMATVTTDAMESTTNIAPTDAGTGAVANNTDAQAVVVNTISTDDKNKNAAAIATPGSTTAEIATTNNVMVGNLVKKSISFDGEYVLRFKEGEENQLPSQIPAAGVGIASDRKNFTITEFDIKNFQFVNPLYKISANGKIVFNDNEQLAINDPISTCDLMVKIENINNLLTYIKNFEAKLFKNDIVNDPQISNMPNSTTEQDSKVAATAPTTTINTGQTIINDSPNPKLDFATIIYDLAKGNPGSTDNIALFAIKKTQSSNFSINDVSLVDLMAKFAIILASHNNNINIIPPDSSSASDIMNHDMNGDMNSDINKNLENNDIIEKNDAPKNNEPK